MNDLLNRQPVKDTHQTLLILLVSLGFALLFFSLEGWHGFSLWDEGFMWYGAQRVMLGEMPNRDFMGYDPGRYFWSASIMKLYGNNGIIALRAAEAAVQAIGLYIGLSLLGRSTRKLNFVYLLLVGVTLAIWMSERHRVFDSALPIAQIGILAYWLHQPSYRRYFWAGLGVGFMTLFGRNHCLYGVFGSLVAIGYLAIGPKQGPPIVKATLLWALGFIAGCLPILLMLVFVPGFALAFWDSIRLLFEIKTTNYPLPVPWPWTVDFRPMEHMVAASWFMAGIFFLAIAAFSLLGFVWVMGCCLRRKTVDSVMVACVVMSIPYAHYAFSRADVYHLENGIFSLLIACFALLANRPAGIKWPLAGLLCGASFMVMLPYHPAWQCYAMKQCVATKVGVDTLVVDVDTSNDLKLLNRLAEDFAPGDQTFVATPFWPGAYAALGRKSPLWEIYALFPRSLEFQQAEIERINNAKPGFVIVFDIPLDNRDELRFRNTHPLLQKFIIDTFEPAEGYTKNPAYQIYKKRTNAQSNNPKP